MPFKQMLAAVALVIAAGATSGAQVNVEPTRYPAVTAADREWFRARQAIFFAGDSYWPAGAEVYFQPDVMVVTGEFDGVPLLADASRPPYDQVLVPLGGNRLRPYERKREGRLTGTSGSSSPTLPTDLAATGRTDEMNAWTQPRRGGSRAVQDPPRQPAPPEEPVAASGTRIETVRRPQGNRGIWIRFEGARWESAGEAVPYDPAEFRSSGTYHGFPVYRRKAASTTTSPDEIYLRSRDEVVAPYRRVAESR